MKKLNIPIEASATRHIERRVVWILCSAGLGLMAGMILFGIWTSRDVTSSHAPENTQFTIHVKKTARTSKIFSETQSKQLLDPIAPWSVSHLINTSNREFSLHFSNLELVGFTFDQSIDPQVAEFLESTGTTVTQGKHWTTVSKKPVDSSQKHVIVRPFSFIPGRNGHVIDLVNEKTTSMTLNRKGMTIKHAGFKPSSTAQALLPSAATPFVSFFLKEDGSTLPGDFTNLLAGPSKELQTLVTSYGGHILLAKDDEGIIYALHIPTTNLSVESLSALGKDILGRSSLTTTALTSNTGEIFNEIRINTEHLESSIRAEEDFTYITVQNNIGDIIRITKTGGGVIITNRDFSAEVSQESPKSSCLLKAHSFVSVNELEAIFDKQPVIEPASEQQLFPIFSIGELAFSKRKTRLCW